MGIVKDSKGYFKTPVNSKHSSKRAERCSIILEAYDSPEVKTSGRLTRAEMLIILLQDQRLSLKDCDAPSLNTYLKHLVKWMVEQGLIIRHGGQGDKETVYERDYEISNPFKKDSEE